MSTQNEFIKWLNRSEKTLEENLQFAIKAWISAEFLLNNKYDIIIKWFCTKCKEEGKRLKKKVPYIELHQLLALPAQPGTIATESKLEFIKLLLELIQLDEKQANYREDNVKLLRQMLEVEWLQDVLRTDYTLAASCYGKLFKCYQIYLQEKIAKKQTLMSAYEAEYFNCTLKIFKDYIKRIGDVKAVEPAYDQYIVEPLIEALLTMKQECDIDFFEELQTIENQLRQEHSPENLVTHVFKAPSFHVRLFTLECAIASWHKDTAFMEHLLKNVFKILDSNETQGEHLLFCAFVFDILRKHNGSVNFIMKKSENEKATMWMGVRLFECVKKLKTQHLREVLLLLNAVLRMNPLILEQHIFEIMTWLMLTPKDNENSESELLETFLLLVLDMFRRLSRTEKFVANLLKAIKQWLGSNPVPKAHVKKLPKESKRKSEVLREEETPRKRRKTSQNVDEDANEEASSVVIDCKYLEKYFQRFFQPNEDQRATTYQSYNVIQSFPYLHSFWSWDKVGKAFSRLITGLVTKPSLVIWKTLLYSLKELLESIAGEESMDERFNECTLFQLDLISALLCQYFGGLKVPEQYEKHAGNLQELRILTHTVLSSFGKIIINQNDDSSYQRRPMHAFLECVYYFTNYELLCAYYKPDGTNDPHLESAHLIGELHGFLTKKEWKSIEKSIANFGKSNCNFFYKRLLLQRQQASVLLRPMKNDDNITDGLMTQSCFSHDDIKQILLCGYKPNAVWFLKSLDRSTRQSFIKATFGSLANIDLNLLTPIAEDLESLELTSYTLMENLDEVLRASGKKSLHVLLNCDFEKLRQSQPDDYLLFDNIIKSMATVIDENAKSIKTKTLPLEEMTQSIEILAQLPMGCLRRQTKSVIFALLLALYHDLNLSKCDELKQRIFNILINLLHFGQNIPVFKYFNADVILHILPVESCWPFYELLFGLLKNEDKGNEKFLLTLEQHLRSNLISDDDLQLKDDANLRLLLIAMQTLSSLSGPYGKRMLKYLYSMMEIFSKFIKTYFDCKDKDKVKNFRLNEKEFVELTLSGFAPYALFLLNAHKKEQNKKSKTENDQEDNSTNKTDEEETIKGLGCVDENFRRICKIYLGHSVNYRNQHAIRLMQIALNNREQLHLDQDEIECVLSLYWRQLNEDLRATQESEEEEALQLISTKTTESVVKMIIGNKTNEDLLLILKDINHMLDDMTKLPFVLCLLNLITKSAFSTIKGAIFNEQFKLITCNIAMHLERNEQQQFNNHKAILSILTCQQAFVENKTIPISPDTLDNILEFLATINIKKFQLNDENEKSFFKLHASMTQLCSSLIKHRHVLLMDRVAQFMHIFKDLLQSIVHYKSDRQKDTGLSSSELDDLADLGLKLEVLMHVIAKHSLDMKRIAPFVLTFAINLMVVNKRSTTLYPKIKSHVEAICHGLIGICDHRVGRFILRCSNEAARQSYELLVKDHKKYHKFKGKI